MFDCLLPLNAPILGFQIVGMLHVHASCLLLTGISFAPSDSYAEANSSAAEQFNHFIKLFAAQSSFYSLKNFSMFTSAVMAWWNRGRKRAMARKSGAGPDEDDEDIWSTHSDVPRSWFYMQSQDLVTSDCIFLYCPIWATKIGFRPLHDVRLLIVQDPVSRSDIGSYTTRM